LMGMPPRLTVLCLSTSNPEIHCFSSYRTFFWTNSCLTIRAKGHTDAHNFYCWLEGFVYSSIVLSIPSV
jgi:hypothetical protein